MSRRKLNLVGRVAKVFAAVKKLERNGHGTDYDWTRATDVFEEVRGRLFRAGILINRSEAEPVYVDNQTNGGEWLQECRLRVTYTFTDGESTTEPEHCNGIARKVASDKALYVAQTGADKAFLKRKGLMAEFVDDPEFEEPTQPAAGESLDEYAPMRPPRPARTTTQKQIRVFQEACDQHGKTPEEQAAYLEKCHGVRFIADLGRGRPFTEALQWASADGRDGPAPKLPAVPAQTELPLRTAQPREIELKIGNQTVSWKPQKGSYAL